MWVKLPQGDYLLEVVSVKKKPAPRLEQGTGQHQLETRCLGIQFQNTTLGGPVKGSAGYWGLVE